MNKNPLKLGAIRLRNLGYSYNMINEQLGISKGTLSSWFRDKPFVPNRAVLKRIQYGPIRSAQKKHNQKVREIRDLKELGKQEIGELDDRDLWLLGLGLYIGEGSKSYETIRIINSNPDVIKLAIRWFKKCCNLTDDNITIAIHIYPDNNPRKCLNFWREVTGLPPKNFRKTQIDARENKSKTKRAKLPYGTVHLMIISNGDLERGVRLYRKMSGWIDGVLGQVNTRE